MEMDLDIFEEVDTSFLLSDDATLLNAAHRGDLDKVRKLIEEENHNPYQTGKYGNSLLHYACLLYTSPSPRDATLSRMPSSAWKKK